MKNLINALIGSSIFLGVAAFAQPTMAQSSSSLGLQKGQTTSVNAGVHFKVPFGAVRKEKIEDKARFGLMLSFDKGYTDSQTLITKRNKTEVMDFGFMFTGEPAMFVNGEDIYTPLFVPIYANDADPDQDKSTITVSKKKVLIAAGVAVAAAAIVAVASIDGDDDEDDDDDDDFDDDD